MNRRNCLAIFAFVVVMLASVGVRAQDPASPSGAIPPQQQGRGWGEGENGPRPLFGKITSMNAATIVIAKPDGQKVTVKLTEQTEFRKDREKAAATDFKVGDTVMVRGDESSDHTVTARMIGTRSGGPGGERGGFNIGVLGKDYVAGEVKEIHEGAITVLRVDNVPQTMLLDENSSIRKGRDAIILADVQVGDHVMARGSLQKDAAFVPKIVMVMSPEQWKRMQEMGAQNAPPNKPAAPEAAPAKPQE